MNNCTYDVIVACARTYDDLPKAVCYKITKTIAYLQKKVA
jgi:hypothetical protein